MSDKNTATADSILNTDEAVHLFWAPMLEIAVDVMDDGYGLGHLQVQLWQFLQSNMPNYPTDSNVTLPKLADAFADKIWHTMPNPAQKFIVAKPMQLNRSDRRAAGIKASSKTSSAPVAARPLPPLDDMLCWEVLCTRLATSRIAQLFSLKNLPTGVLTLAAEGLVLDDPRLLVTTAARWFSEMHIGKPDTTHPDLHSVLIHYGQACISLGADELYLDILNALSTHDNKTLRSQILQQLAVFCGDRGDAVKAQQHFDAAYAANPDDLNLASLEVTLLIKNGQRERAQQRASFWVGHFAARQITRPPVVTNLLQAVADGADGILALANSMASILPEWERRFFDVVTKGLMQPISHDLLQSTLQTQNSYGVVEARLIASAAMLDLEREWRQVWPLPKATDSELLPDETLPIWEPPQVERWVSFLENHPQVFNSLEVLDDLRTAFTMLPIDFELDDAVMAPAFSHLLQRADDLLAPVLATSPLLPWAFLENRTALRLMHDYAEALAERHRAGGCAAMLRLLRVEPTDQLGVLGNLVEDLVSLGDDGTIVDVTAEFIPDTVPLIFNRILALYRLGQLEAAGIELQRAHAVHPKVLEWLLPETKAKPKNHMELTTLGPEAEAWLYREAMRDYWAEAQGAVAWLKRTTKAAN